MKVQFKNLELKIVIPGKEPITPQNITTEIYEELVKKNPEYKDLFVLTEEKKEKNKEG